MIKATLYVREDPALLNNEVFSGKSLYGMKSDMYMYVALRRELAKSHIDLSTQDIYPVENSEIVIVLNETAFFRNYKKGKTQKLYLILSEPPVYNFDDWNKDRHVIFDKVFVYDSSLVDNKKYFHYNYAIDLDTIVKPTVPSEEEFASKKLCTLMAGTFSPLPHDPKLKSLLYKRFQTLSWFNRNRPNDFDLFSRTDVEKKFREFRGVSLLQKLWPALVKKIAHYKYQRHCAKVFKGAVGAEKKIEVMNHYKFYICYENTHGINGLISEKIFDCFAAGCVPVYDGAPDIGHYIPETCFIKRSDFISHETLYHYLATMNYPAFKNYIEQIRLFMTSERIRIFEVSSFTKSIISQII